MPGNSQYGPQINEILSIQGPRMEKAAAEEKKRRAAGISESRKRPPAPSEAPTDSKRIKLENSSGGAAFLAGFDFTTLPAALITELIVANLEAFTESELVSLVQAYRELKGISLPAPSKPEPTASASSSSSTPVPASKPIPTGPRNAASAQPPEPLPPSRSKSPTPPAEPKAEPVDPLQMDIDEEEIEFEPERLNEELAGEALAPEEPELPVEADVEKLKITLSEFKLPSPPLLDEDGRTKAIGKAVTRIWDGAEELKDFAEAIPVDSPQAGGNSATELWMLLIVRMMTRVAEPPDDLGQWKDNQEENGKGKGKEVVVHDFYVRQDRLRQTLYEYIMTDFPSR